MQGRIMALILATVVFSVAGQLFLKSGATHLNALGNREFLLAAVRDRDVLLGLAAWTVSTVCWLFVLRVAPLSRAYLLTSLNYALIPLASMYLFGERVRPLYGVGAVLIIAGVVCVVAGE